VPPRPGPTPRRARGSRPSWPPTDRRRAGSAPRRWPGERRRRWSPCRGGRSRPPASPARPAVGLGSGRGADELPAREALGRLGPHLVEADDGRALRRRGREPPDDPLLSAKSGSIRSPNQVSCWREHILARKIADSKREVLASQQNRSLSRRRAGETDPASSEGRGERTESSALRDQSSAPLSLDAQRASFPNVPFNLTTLTPFGPTLDRSPTDLGGCPVGPGPGSASPVGFGLGPALAATPSRGRGPRNLDRLEPNDAQGLIDAKLIPNPPESTWNRGRRPNRPLDRSCGKRWNPAIRVGGPH
jgi:hypothetical protein